MIENIDKSETFESGAVRDTVDYRYDLMSRVMIDIVFEDRLMVRPLAHALMACLTDPASLEDPKNLALDLMHAIGKSYYEIAHLYAQALHEGAGKYGERNWEKGIPESNLVNHALHHLFKLYEGDRSENHASHLVWNVLTIVHFREMEKKPYT